MLIHVDGTMASTSSNLNASLAASLSLPAFDLAGRSWADVSEEWEAANGVAHAKQKPAQSQQLKATVAPWAKPKVTATGLPVFDIEDSNMGYAAAQVADPEVAADLAALAETSRDGINALFKNVRAATCLRMLELACQCVATTIYCRVCCEQERRAQVVTSDRGWGARTGHSCSPGVSFSSCTMYQATHSRCYIQFVIDGCRTLHGASQFTHCLAGVTLSDSKFELSDPPRSAFTARYAL